MELTIEGVWNEIEGLRLRVTALENALTDAGIPIPKTPLQLAAEARAEAARFGDDG